MVCNVYYIVTDIHILALSHYVLTLIILLRKLTNLNKFAYVLWSLYNFKNIFLIKVCHTDVSASFVCVY